MVSQLLRPTCKSQVQKQNPEGRLYLNYAPYDSRASFDRLRYLCPCHRCGATLRRPHDARSVIGPLEPLLELPFHVARGRPSEAAPLRFGLEQCEGRGGAPNPCNGDLVFVGSAGEARSAGRNRAPGTDIPVSPASGGGAMPPHCHPPSLRKGRK